LEYHISKDGSQTFNFGTGGANISPDALYSAIGGTMVWGWDIMSDLYIKGHEFKQKGTYQATFGFGDFEQKKQILRFFFGIDELLVGNDGEYSAKTERTGKGKRTVTINGYRDEMELDEQMRLAVILGHEAYRDGYIPGEIDNKGRYITLDDNFAELKDSVIAHSAMADRINKDYAWFYQMNPDLAFESWYINTGAALDGPDALDNYLRETYAYDEDYYLIPVLTGRDYQNNPDFRNVKLLNGPSQAEVDARNLQEKEAAFERYLHDVFPDEEDIPGRIIDAYMQEFMDDKNLLKKYGYKEEEYFSIYLHGCFLFAILNSLQTITGWEYDILKLNDYVKQNYKVNSDLSNTLFAQIMNDLTYGYFTIELMSHVSAGAGLDQINAFIDDQNNGYIFHMRVNNKSVPGAVTHSVMANGIMKPVNYPGYVSNNTEFKVANSLQNSKTFNGRSYFKPQDVVRWDVFKITPTAQYYRDYSNAKYDSMKYLNPLGKKP
jgi:hypothetical protein